MGCPNKQERNGGWFVCTNVPEFGGNKPPLYEAYQYWNEGESAAEEEESTRVVSGRLTSTTSSRGKKSIVWAKDETIISNFLE